MYYGKLDCGHVRKRSSKPYRLAAGLWCFACGYWCEVIDVWEEKVRKATPQDETLW